VPRDRRRMGEARKPAPRRKSIIEPRRFSFLRAVVVYNFALARRFQRVLGPRNPAAVIARIPLRSVVSHFESLGLDPFHQSLQWTPADLTEVSLVIRHEAPAVADAVDVNVRPAQVAVGLAVAAIANESCFRSHTCGARASYLAMYAAATNAVPKDAIARPSASAKAVRSSCILFEGRGMGVSDNSRDINPGDDRLFRIKAVSIVLYFVQPIRPGGNLGAARWDAWLERNCACSARRSSRT
jgi:hypothetical protein